MGIRPGWRITIVYDSRIDGLLQFLCGSDAFPAAMEDNEREEAPGVQGVQDSISGLSFPALDTGACFGGQHGKSCADDFVGM